MAFIVQRFRARLRFFAKATGQQDPVYSIDSAARDAGLRTKRRVSHCFVLQTPYYPRPFIVTDAAINIAPDLPTKVDIVQNAIDLAHALQLPAVRVALLSATGAQTETIPPSIVKKDNMAQRSGRSLARSGMKWVGRRIVQEPGPRNSLGIVKFDLRNGHAIYLHDTPAKGLFAASRRWRSHGCVRVKDASGFATLIATDSGQAERWGELTAGEATASLPLPREIPVRLLYATVLLDEAQAPVFGADPYDWDAPVARRLGFAVPLPVTKPKEGAADSGP